MFAFTGCKVGLPAAWSITAQSFIDEIMRVAGLMGVEVGVLMVVT